MGGGVFLLETIERAVAALRNAEIPPDRDGFYNFIGYSNYGTTPVRGVTALASLGARAMGVR